MFQRPRLEPGLRLCIARDGVSILKSVAAMKKHFLKFNLSIQNETKMDIDNYTAYELACQYPQKVYLCIFKTEGLKY